MIAAVVPTLGDGPLLRESLRALRRERVGGEPVEVILVRQGRLHHDRTPDPETEELCHRVITVERNLGFTGATNLGIAIARDLGTSYVATVNDDLQVAPGWTERLVSALEAEPDLAAVQGVNLLLDNPGRVDGCGLGWNRWWQAVQLRRGESAPPPDGPVEEIFGVSATAALYRIQALDRAGRWDGSDLSEASAGSDASDGSTPTGPFDPRLGSYYEDVDLACRLRAAGFRTLLVPAARALHAGSATGGGMAFRRWRWIHGNRLLVLARLLGRRFPRELPPILTRDVRDLARAAVTLQLRRAAGVMAGWGRAARHLPAYAHRGAPRIPLGELARFRVSSPSNP